MITNFTVSGNLTRDPVLEFHGERKLAIAKFTIASNSGADAPDLVPLVAFDKQAVAISKFKRKGQYLSVEAKVDSKPYVDAEGQNRIRPQFKVVRAEFGPKVDATLVEPEYQLDFDFDA